MINSKDIEFIFTKIRKTQCLSNLRYKNINFRINAIIISNLTIISYLIYEKK